MTVKHDTFTLTRHINAAPDIVFDAWADPEKKRVWFVDSDGPGWSESAYQMDFRVGGMESGRFELADGPGAGVHENKTHFLDIVANSRIVYAYVMAIDGRIHSASLATVTFELRGRGTRLTYTEQGTFIGESDGAEVRTHGWTHLLSALTEFIEKGDAR